MGTATVPLTITELFAGLIEAARLVSDAMRTKTSTGEYPHNMSQSIVVDPPMAVGNNKLKITIRVGHPASPAFEFGSGIHSTQGSQEKYKIEAKNAPVLAFPWQPAFIPYRSPKFRGVKLESRDSTKGTYFFDYVMHPGIEAKPFARPSLEENRDEMVSVLKRSFVAAIGTGRREKIKVEVNI